MIFKISDSEKINIEKFYDVTFVLAATLDTKKYTDRFHFLVDVGLRNQGRKSVSVIALLGKEGVPQEIIDVCSKSSVDFYFVNNNMAYPSNSTKLSSFFVKYKKINTKYVIKIDEDSITDIGGIYENLDKLGRFEYLTTDVVMTDCDTRFVRPFTEQHQMNLPTPYSHEWECCVTTVDSINRVINNTHAMMLQNQHYLNTFNTNGDHTWAPSFIIAGVHIRACKFISPFFNFRYFGTKFFHIHYAAPDYGYCKRIKEVLENGHKFSSDLKKLIAIYGSENSNIAHRDVIGKNFSIVKDKVDEILVSKFNANGEIGDIKYINESFKTSKKLTRYEIIEGNLVIYDSSDRPCLILSRENTPSVFRGYNLNGNISRMSVYLLNKQEQKLLNSGDDDHMLLLSRSRRGFKIGHQMLGDVIGFCAAAHLLSKKTGTTIQIFFPQESRKDICKYFTGIEWVPKSIIPNAIDCGGDPGDKEWPNSNGVKRFYRFMDKSMTNPETFDIHMNIKKVENPPEKLIGLITHSHTQGPIEPSNVKFMCMEAKKEYPDHKIVLLGENNTKFTPIPGIEIEDWRVPQGTPTQDLVEKISNLSVLLSPQTGPCFIAAGLKIPMWIYRSKTPLSDYVLNYDTHKVARWFDRKDFSYPPRKDWLEICRAHNREFYNKIIDTIGYSGVVIVKRKDAANIGDFSCSPALYFNLPVIDVIDIDDKRSIDNYLRKRMNFIIGGGGLLYSPKWINNMEEIVNNAPNTFIWAIGKNAHGEDREYKYPEFLSKARLVGLRDRDQTEYPWLPCVSCMSDVFDVIEKPIQPTIVYSHHNAKIEQNSKTNKEFQTMKDAVDYLSLGEKVITNSYHGAFWSILLEKEVIIRNQFSNRLSGL